MKINCKLLVLVIAVLFTLSCKKEVENWSTEAVDYAGKFITKCYNGSGVLLHKYNTNNNAVLISNSAANTTSQIIVQADYLGIRNKLDITGSPENFKSTKDDFGSAFNNEAVVVAPTSPPINATDIYSLSSSAIKTVLVSASIKKDGFTTKGNNITDKFSMQVKCFSGTATFKAVPEKPGSKYFKWELKSVEQDASKTTMIYKVEGFRHTGFHEDDWK